MCKYVYVYSVCRLAKQMTMRISNTSGIRKKDPEDHAHAQSLSRVEKCDRNSRVIARVSSVCACRYNPAEI